VFQKAKKNSPSKSKAAITKSKSGDILQQPAAESKSPTVAVEAPSPDKIVKK
jgi:hypothetical protein